MQSTIVLNNEWQQVGELFLCEIFQLFQSENQYDERSYDFTVYVVARFEHLFEINVAIGRNLQQIIRSEISVGGDLS